MYHITDNEIENIFDVIESALSSCGFTVMDGDHSSIIIRNKISGIDYLISIQEEEM